MTDSNTDPSHHPAPPEEVADLRQQLADARRELAQGARERQALRDLEALLRNELQHRVRNTLATVRSIFSRTVNASASLEQLADHFCGRLDAISRFQPIRSFEASDARGAFDLEHMLRDELHSFRFGDDPQITITGTEVRLQTDIAQLIGLALHELVTNSIKFGVLAARDDRRRLNVSWTLHDGRLRILWREFGVPVLASAPLPRGFGRAFIEGALPAHREIVAEGAAGLTPSIVLDGWACRVRYYPDGRRQILGFLLPGELIGVCRHREPLALTTIVAMTPVALSPAPSAETSEGSGLEEAYAVSAALEQSYLFRHVARLGRLNAYERLLDWLLEMRERLALSGHATDVGFRLPLTQEALADALGLTSVHVNRTLQLMRGEKLIELSGGVVRLMDPQRLAELVDYRPARVTAAPDGYRSTAWGLVPQ